jgi:hypothetical protein
MARGDTDLATQNSPQNIGRFAALGATAWLILPLFSVQGNRHALETALTVGLGGVALLATWRFHIGQGGTTGAIALVVVLIEATKRLWMTIEGQPGFGTIEGILVLMIAAGLFSGVRVARAVAAHPPLG